MFSILGTSYLDRFSVATFTWIRLRMLKTNQMAKMSRSAFRVYLKAFEILYCLFIVLLLK